MPNEKQISERLISLGFRPDIDGYRYALMAVKLLIEDSKYRLHNDIYPVVAKAFKAKPAQVERSIRHSIQVAFETMTPAWMDIYQGWHEGGKPTNRWFLAMVAEEFRLRAVS